MNVLLMDTDADQLKIFRGFIKSSFPEIKQVVTLSDHTRDVITAVKAAAPRLIIADIRFFGVDNHKKIGAVCDRFPDVRFLLYGTYNDAEYMKKSMEYGVVSYMLRPVRQADFQRNLAGALDYLKKLDEQRAREDEFARMYRQRIFLFEEIFLKKLVSGSIKDEPEILRSFEYFKLGLSPDFCVFVIHIDHFRKVMLALDDTEKHILIYKILRITEEKLTGTSAKAFIDGFDAVIGVLGNDVTVEGAVALCESIKDVIYIETNIRVTIGIGRSYTSAADIAVSYREALGALLYRFHMGYNTVIHIIFCEPSNSMSYRYPTEREERLIHTASIGEYDYCVKLLKELFDALRQCEPLPEMYLSKVIMNILISINKTLSEQNIRIQSPFTSFFPSHEVLELDNDIDEAFQYLTGALKNFCEHVVKSREEQNSSIVERAKVWLDEKYYAAFSIARVATEVGATPEYLNRVFLERESKGVAEYLVTVRINEAKKLMRETEFDDDIVAVRVGYADARHFRSVFKKETNMTTREYRSVFRIDGGE